MFGLIHADLHPGNVLVGPGGLTVIDFDDAGFGWHVYDMAVALYYVANRPDFPTLRAAFLSGYSAVRDLPPHTEDLLPMFLLIRSLALIGWLHQRPEIDPGLFFAERKASIMEACRSFKAPC
jgi:Ser/Thr protein kinase RdoA (MazF antagonist)